jgi:FAD/FMN-containing dehydrogenase
MAKFDLEKLHQLRNSVGKGIDILTDPTDAAFIKHAKRWTDIDRKIPAAIILPASEEEIQKTVCVL